MFFESLAGSLAGPVELILGAAAKGALLIALAFFATRLLHHRSAAARHAIWAGALLGHLLLLVSLPFVPRLEVPLLPAPAVEHSVAPAPAVGEATAPLAADVVTTPAVGQRAGSSTTSIAGPGQRLPSPFALLVAVWLAGAAVVFARYLVGTARVARLARESERIADGTWLSLAHRMAIGMGIARPLTLVRGSRLDVPVTWGILYPVVFLPADADSWDEDRQRFVLVHELAHVKRLDAVTQLLTQITVALFWFDPLVWYAAGRIRVERERACDDQVLLHGVRPSLYADELLDMVTAMSPRRADPAPAFAALAMARRSEFEGRMLAILDPQAQRGALSRGVRLAMVAAAFALVLPLAAFHPTEARPVNAADPVVASQSAAEASGTRDAKQAPAAPATANTATTSAGVAAQSATVEQPRYRCSAADLSYTGRQVSVHEHTDEDPAQTFTEALLRSPGRCTFALMRGNVTLAADMSDVASVAPSAQMIVHEITPGLSRELTISGAADGSLARRYSENGSPADVSRANRWLPALLRTLVLEGGLRVVERVPQLRASGGVGAVLEEAGQVTSSGVKRLYLQTLLKSQPRLTQDETDRVIREAAAGISSSSDLRAVLETAISYANPSPDAIVAAVSRMNTDGDRRSMLTRSLLNPDLKSGSSLLSGRPLDPEVVRTALRATTEIGGDGDKSAVLVAAAPHAFRTAALRAEFYRALATVNSSGDKRRVLTAAVRHTPKDIGAIRDFLAAVEPISSDGDKAAVLLAGIRQGLSSGDAAREAFLQTLRGIESDGDKSRVMTALLR